MDAPIARCRCADPEIFFPASRLVWRRRTEGPLLDFLRDQLAEVGGEPGRASQVGEPCLDLGIGEASIDLLVELVADLGRRGRLGRPRIREKAIPLPA
jgi:hypothetical protein